jgi:serine/threonine-protein kinase
VGYFLLTGHSVFAGKTVMEVCGEHLHAKPVSPSQRLGKALPADLERTLLACLEKAPEARPESADALRDVLIACDVPRWTLAEARAWWKTHQPAPRSLDPEAKPESMTALDVDLGARW